MIQWAIFKTIEAKGGLEYMLLWPMVNLCLNVAQIGDLSSEIQGFEKLMYIFFHLTKFSLFDQASSFGLNYFENRQVDHFKASDSKFSL